MENTDSEFFPETDSNSTTSSYDSIPLIRIESIDEITIESSDQTYTDFGSEVSSLENDIVKLINDDNTDSDDNNDSDDNDDSDDEIIKEDDFTELTTTAYDIMEEYIKQNILSLSSPKFYTSMIMHTTEVLYVDVLYSTNIDDDMDKTDEEILFEEIKIIITGIVDIISTPLIT